MASRLQPQDAEAVLRVVEGDPLDETRENFGLGVCLLTHATSANGLFVSAVLLQDLIKPTPVHTCS